MYHKEAKQFLSPNKIGEWLTSWRKRLKIQSVSFKKIKMSMQKENPAFIPRNHRIEKAIYEAVVIKAIILGTTSYCLSPYY